MCGIAGVIHYAGGVADEALVRRMTDVQQHRGPDDSGTWAEGPVALGHRRLSIVDLSPAGHQPMPAPDGSLWVTYNGELYGWPAIRARLAGRGHRFRGTSDTEALLHLYEERGDDLFAELRGMFAFALHDRTRRRTLVARDRLGIKPLYYHDDGRRLVFASELKALVQDPSVPREVDRAAVADYLTHQYVPGPRTVFAGVRKLAAGHYLVVDENGVALRRYWSLPAAEPGPDLGAAHYRDALRAELEEAVRLRLVADVPLGAFLSGGIDSSAVVALMRRVSTGRVATFSIGFTGPGAERSEVHHARRVAEHLGTDHTEFEVRPTALDVLPRLVEQLDEPFADASAIPTYYVSRAARAHVTVALSGDGGDETFGGYVTYPWARAYHRADVVPAPLRRLLARPAGLLPADHPLGRRLRRVGMDVVDRHLDVSAFFAGRELSSILSPEWREDLRGHDTFAGARRHYDDSRVLGPVPALLRLDAATYLVDDVLTKVDRMSMLNSLEVRVPLLDHKVQEFAATIPFHHKVSGGVTKKVLRESVRDLLPPDILGRGKQGFGVPLSGWLGADFGTLAREVLLDPRVSARGWLDPAAVSRLVVGTGLRPEVRAKRLWSLICLELWAQTCLDAPSAAAAPDAVVVSGGSR